VKPLRNGIPAGLTAMMNKIAISAIQASAMESTQR
jgi:hypothetical protein